MKELNLTLALKFKIAFGLCGIMVIICYLINPQLFYIIASNVFSVAGAFFVVALVSVEWVSILFKENTRENIRRKKVLLISIFLSAVAVKIIFSLITLIEPKESSFYLMYTAPLTFTMSLSLVMYNIAVKYRN